MHDWRFVGRDAELRLLRELVADDDMHGVVIFGPPGVGKSRLGLEHVQRMEGLGYVALRTRATRSAAGIPFGALATLLPAHSDNAIGSGDDRADLIRRTALAVEERGGDRPMVLFVDDAHCLDESSATLLHHLTVTGAVQLVATARVGVSAPDAVVALWKDGLVERLDLGPLPDDDVALLVRSAVRGPVDPAAVSALTACCRGNALFLRELVLGALQTGALAEEGGLWRLRRALMPSDRLIELVEMRLGHLDEGERHLLELVSFGEPIGREELRVLADPALVEGLERRSILSSRMNGRRLEVRLAHPIYGEVVRAETPPVRALEVARFLADVVEGTGCRRREDMLRVATWRLVVGGAKPETMLAAAHVARWRYDFGLAERLAQAAADGGAGFDAAVLLAQLASLQGRRDEAEAALVSLAAQAGNDQQRGQVAALRLNNSAVWQGDDSEHVFDDAMAGLTDPTWRDELEALHLSPLLNDKGPRVAAAASEALLSRAEGQALSFACLINGYSLARLGRVREALAATEQGRATPATGRPGAWYGWWQFFVRSAALSWVGRFSEGVRVADEHYQTALAEHSVEAQAAFALVPVFGVGEVGNVEASLDHIREATSLHLDLDRPIMLRYCYAYGAIAAALAGRAAEARQAIVDLDALRLPRRLQQEVDVIEARAWTAVAAGNLPEARRRLREAWRLGCEIGDLVGETSALHGLARLGQAAEVRDRLAATATEMEGELVVGRVLHTDGLVHADVERLQAAADLFERLGAHLLAAEAATDAAVHLGPNGGRAAQAARRRARVLAGRCPGVVTPALTAIDVRARLTPAERDTAHLAMAGRSNREIADELCLSVRTVENRLHRTYEKLGISGRGELSVVFEEPTGGVPPDGPGHGEDSQRSFKPAASWST